MSDLFQPMLQLLLEKAAGCRGQTLVEYALILAFIATMIAALATVVGGTNGLLDYIEGQLTNALG